MVHVVNKGKNGEREVVNILKEVMEFYISENLDDLTTNQIDLLRNVIKRNLQQSRQGGCDIIAFHIAFEVKRCETLEVQKWWKQCDDNATNLQHIPVLIYKQNRKPWQVYMEIGIKNYPRSVSIPVYSKAEGLVSMDTFKSWFYLHLKSYVETGLLERFGDKNA